MRNKIIFGNWKLNNDLTESLEFCFQLRMFLGDTKNKEMIEEKRIIIGLSPQYPLLYILKQHLDPSILIISQNISIDEKGAFTGEVSPDTLLSVGISTTIIGHSERRRIFKEDNDIIRKKVNNALSRKMGIVLCCGEPKEIREKGQEKEFVLNQLKYALKNVTINDILNIYIAYEPIWAIGTGITATSSDAEEMCAEIRNFIKTLYTNHIANEIHILYGGSVNENNIKNLCSQNNIDGALIGGASLHMETFKKLLVNC